MRRSAACALLATAAVAAALPASSAAAKAPTTAAGFDFKALPAQAAQEYRERGRRGRVTVRFVYRVPNG